MEVREEWAQWHDPHGRDLLDEQIRRVGGLCADSLVSGRQALALHRLHVPFPACRAPSARAFWIRVLSEAASRVC